MFDRTLFISAICRLREKFGLDPFSDLGEIAVKVMLKMFLKI